MVESYLLIILIIFTTVSTNRLLIVYKVGISTPRSRGGGSVEFKVLKIILFLLDFGLSCSDAQFRSHLKFRSNIYPY